MGRIITLVFLSLVILAISLIELLPFTRIIVLGVPILGIFLLLTSFRRKILIILLIFLIILSMYVLLMDVENKPFPISFEDSKLSAVFYAINQAEQKYFHDNNKYGILQELEKEYIAPEVMQDIRKMHFFMITIWADTKSFQCIVTTSVKGLDLAYKLDETGILKQYRMGKTYNILPNKQLKIFDFDNSTLAIGSKTPNELRRDREANPTKDKPVDGK